MMGDRREREKKKKKKKKSERGWTIKGEYSRIYSFFYSVLHTFFYLSLAAVKVGENHTGEDRGREQAGFTPRC